MITGYNTDVRHGEVVFHVQTEDKGVSNPYIESLVYVGGQVLASKRASYAEMIAEGKEEKEIVALMDHQHRTMIAAIRHGKLDGKLAALSASRMTGPMPVATPQTGVQPVILKHPSGPVVSPPPAAPADIGETVARALGGGETLARPATATATPETPMEPMAARPARPAVSERTLDQVILEYLTSEADQEQLVLTLDGEQETRIGRPAVLALRTSSSKTGLPVAGTQISVKMISTVSEPRVLAAGRTDERGALRLLFEIPALSRGTAALIVSAVSAIGRAELKQLL